MTDWDQRFMHLAAHVSSWSKDPSTKVGAIIVGHDKRDVAIGFNGFPAGISDDARLGDRSIKYKFIQHAERNVLDNAKFPGRTLYCTAHPCCECTKSIISKGIKHVHFYENADYETRWAEDVALSRSLLAEAGIASTRWLPHGRSDVD